MNEENIKIPHYRRLYELLRKQIIEGIFKEGDLLPSENELCSLHKVTRPTIRQALAALVNEGYIKKQQGKGSIVDRLPKGIGILSVEGTTSALGKEFVKTHIIVKPVLIGWPRPFMFELTDDIFDSGCIYMERLRYYNDVPIFYDINYLPNHNLSRFTSRKFEDISLFDTLREHYQIEITGGEQKIKAIRADKKISEYLQVKKGHPVLHLERKIDTNRIDFSVYSSIYCNTENHAIYGVF